MNRLNLVFLSALLGSLGHAFAQAGEVVCVGADIYGLRNSIDSTFTQVACGTDHILGLREDGTIECWGENQYGQCDAPVRQMC